MKADEVCVQGTEPSPQHPDVLTNQWLLPACLETQWQGLCSRSGLTCGTPLSFSGSVHPCPAFLMRKLLTGNMRGVWVSPPGARPGNGCMGVGRDAPGRVPPPLLLLPLLQDAVARLDPPLHLLCPAALESSPLPLLRAAWPEEMIQLGTCVLSLGLSRRKPQMPPAAGQGRGEGGL